VTLSANDRARYQRHLALREVGVAGQQKLKAARVLVVGAGGLGSPSALYLAASGVGTLGLVDGDHVELSNLQRQVLFDTASISRPKAEAGRDRLMGLNPDIDVIAHAVEVRAANVSEIIAGYDVVLDGTERLGTRDLVNDACVIARKPLVSAAIHRFEGHAMTYVPHRGPCYRCLFPEAAEGLVPNCADAGVLGVLPGVLGAIQATEAIKLILGAGETLVGRLLTYDALEMRFHEFRFARRADCAVCGDAPTIDRPRDAVQPLDEVAAANVHRISATELQGLLRDVHPRGSAPLLVDVREPHEFSVGHLAGAINIPVGELPRRLREIPVAPVFMCRSGGRSLAACRIAAGAGVAEATNLEGGLLAWARDVDPTFEVAAVN